MMCTNDQVLITPTNFEQLCRGAKEFLEDNGLRTLCNEGNLPYLERKDLLANIEHCVAAIIGLDKCDEEFFDNAKHLKVLAKFGVGVDNIDLVSAAKHGVKVINALGANANAVAELTLGMILNLLREISNVSVATKRGEWTRTVGHEIRGKTVGLLGFGTIAKLVAKKLQSLEVKLIAHDLYPDFQVAKHLNTELVSFERLLGESDILSLHIPGTSENYNLFDEDVFSLMKDGAYLVNVARGSLIDETALLNSLDSGKLAGAALDVYKNEPIEKTNLLLFSPKTICTPHYGAETFEAYENVSMVIARGVIDALNGLIPNNWVNRW